MKTTLNNFILREKNNCKLALFLLLILGLSCARMSSPGGGEKDEQAPVALRSKPINYSTNFNDKKIIVEFDEFVSLKNVNQELLVSPPVPEKPQIKQRGKTLIIKINNTLKDSTTYNFNFYNSIVDLNEGNPLKNFQFEFSTGPEFDSIYLGGIMHDGFNYSTDAGWFVMLYENFNDTIPRTTLPNYIAKTDKEGRFFITNLKNKPYYIFGLKDMNNNMLFDLPNENIAFIDSTFSPGFIEHTFVDTLSIIKSISPNLKDTLFVDTLVYHKHMITTISDIRLFMFEEDFIQQYFKQAYRPEKQQIAFAFNEELKDSFSIIPLIDSLVAHDWFLKEKFDKNDSIVYWITDSSLYNKDSLTFQINYTMKDSNQNNYIKTDTLNLVFETPKQKEDKKKGDKKEGSRFNLNFLSNSDDEEIKEDTIIPPSELTFVTNAKAPFELNKPVELIARFPIQSTDKSQIQFMRIEDDTVKIPIKYELIQDKLNFRKYFFEFEKDEEESFELLIPAGTLVDIFGNLNDTLNYKFKTQPLNYYATILMDISGVKENSIVQLLSEKEQVIEEKSISTDTMLFFEYLAPAKYKFKLFYDTNGNGKWDTGNYKELKQAERVFYYPYFPEILETKSNLDIENSWLLYPKTDNKPSEPLQKSTTSDD